MGTHGGMRHVHVRIRMYIHQYITYTGTVSHSQSKSQVRTCFGNLTCIAWLDTHFCECSMSSLHLYTTTSGAILFCTQLYKNCGNELAKHSVLSITISFVNKANELQSSGSVTLVRVVLLDHTVSHYSCDKSTTSIIAGTRVTIGCTILYYMVKSRQHFQI